MVRCRRVRQIRSPTVNNGCIPKWRVHEESRDGFIEPIAQDGRDSRWSFIRFVADRGIRRGAFAQMRTVPMSGDLVHASRAYLSWILVAFRCTHCNESTHVEGTQDEVLLLWRHRGHLGSVTVYFLLNNLGRSDLSRTRMTLWPAERQVVALFCCVN
jgi:hypothetical protein